MDFKVLNTKLSGLKIELLKYIASAKADKQVQVLTVPDSLIAPADATAQANLVGKGALLRVSGTASQYLWFGDSTLGVPTVTDATAMEMPSGFFHITATDDYVRTSIAARIEVISE